MGTDWLRLGTRGLAAAVLPGFSTLMRQAAEHEEAVNTYLRRAIALGVGQELAQQALDEAIEAAQQSPRPFHISQAEERLRRMTEGDSFRYYGSIATSEEARAEAFRVEFDRLSHQRSDPIVRQAFEDIPSRHWVREPPESYRAEFEARRAAMQEAMQALSDRLVRDFWAAAETPPRESHFDAIDRLTAPHVDTGYRYNPNDQGSFDAKPDDCWRCCAVPAENDLGTCNACRDDLRG